MKSTSLSVGQFVTQWNKSHMPQLTSVHQEGYIEELSTCFYLDTVLLKSTESVLSEI